MQNMWQIGQRRKRERKKTKKKGGEPPGKGNRFVTELIQLAS